MNVSNLKLEPTLHRKGGSGKQERFTYDFVIDGKSLANILQVHVRDQVGCLDVINPKGNINRAKALLLAAPADLAPNRYMVYVCPECEDLGCGAITVAITKSTDKYIWSDFRYEVSYDAALTEEYPHVGPFEFGLARYESLLAGFD
jgi:hypothetical protein